MTKVITVWRETLAGDLNSLQKHIWQNKLGQSKIKLARQNDNIIIRPMCSVATHVNFLLGCTKFK